MRRPTSALVVSILALVVAAAGGGYAATGLVTSRDIKNGTIRMNDLAPTVQKQVRKAGRPGPRGLVGPAGPPATPGVAAVEVAAAASELAAGGGYRGAVAGCPAGKQLVGGGGAVEGVAGPQMTVTGPTGDGRWRATGFSSANFGAWQVTAYAICVVTP